MSEDDNEGLGKKCHAPVANPLTLLTRSGSHILDLRSELVAIVGNTSARPQKQHKTQITRQGTNSREKASSNCADGACCYGLAENSNSQITGEERFSLQKEGS